jgi:hypothetical protein
LYGTSDYWVASLEKYRIFEVFIWPEISGIGFKFENLLTMYCKTTD